MLIQGFGSFHEDQIVSATCQRFVSARNEAMDLTAPTAAELGITTINVPVTFGIRINTFRDQSEWATDYIKNGRPQVFEILVSTGDTSDGVAVKMVAAFDEWVAKFNYAEGLPFTYANASGLITFTLKDSTLLFREYVEFKVNREVSPIVPATTKFVDTGLVAGTGATSATVPMADTTGLIVGDFVTIGTSLAAGETEKIITITTDTSIVLENSITFVTADLVYLKTTAVDPTFDGKYLEENVRMSLSTTSDSYGISPDEKPLISGQYTSIEFVMNDATAMGIDGAYEKHKFLGTTRGEIGGTREFKFTLYVLEGTDMFTTGAGNKVFDIVDFLDDSSITPVLKLGNGEIAADAAAFVA